MQHQQQPQQQQQHQQHRKKKEQQQQQQQQQQHQQQQQLQRSADIIVVGDAQTGKTSLITTLVSSIFPEAVPRVLQQVRVPPEETADHVALSITDTSSAEQERPQTLKQVMQADVVILVYAVDNQASFERIRSYWLPEITQAFDGPIVIVGNKNDLLSSNSKDGDAAGDPSDALRRKVNPILDDFSQVEACWECSAKLNINVADVFSLAQQTVVYPIAPLFNTQTRELQPGFITALRRVFRIFDQDRDGVLSDVELNDFQESCFGARLQHADIDDLKSMLQSEGPDRVTGHGITFQGYLSIHKKFIQRNRAETSWLVLRQFGYDDNLELQVPTEALSIGSSGPQVRSRSVELTKKALTFFADLFHQFDEDKDQALSSAELAELFQVCPGGLAPWNLDTEELPLSGSADIGPPDSAVCSLDDLAISARTDENGNITLAGWLAEWSMITLLQPRLALLYLYYLGFDRSKEEAVRLTRSRQIENQNNDLHRDVVRGVVFGAQSVGKSALLEALTGSLAASPNSGISRVNSNGGALKQSSSAWTFSSDYHREIGEDDRRKPSCRSTVSRIRLPSVSPGDKTMGPASRYLVLTEIGTDQDALEEAFANNMVDADLAVLMFDSSNPSSVDWLSGVQKRIPETVPCVYLANKTDLVSARSGGAAGSQALDEASALCFKHNLPLPEPVCLRAPVATQKSRQKTARLFELLLSVALRPDAARPISEERRKLQRRNRLFKASLRLSMVAVVLVSTGVTLWTLFSPTKGSKESPATQNTTKPSNSMLPAKLPT